jgi:hypothetical protein
MVLQHSITRITRITRSCGGSRKSLITRQGPIGDNRKVRAGEPVVTAALPCPAGGEPGRWS